MGIDAREGELDINEELEIPYDTEPIYTLSAPFAACCFVTNEVLFVSVFANNKMMHHQFFYDNLTKIITNHSTKHLCSGNRMNYPVRCFYNSQTRECYTFYRQG